MKDPTVSDSVLSLRQYAIKYTTPIIFIISIIILTVRLATAEVNPVPFALAIFTFINLTVLYLLTLSGKEFRFGVAYVLIFMIITVTSFAYYAGGLPAPGFTLLLVAPYIGLILSGPRLAWITLFIILLITAIFLYLHTSGHSFPEHALKGNDLILMNAFTFTMCLFIITFISTMYATNNKHLHNTLNEQAKYDYLTGLYNRRHLQDVMNKELARAARNKNGISILLIDIDNFKQYNDTYGHMAGDYCLEKVASILLESVRRPPDVVARYGGEEFIIILPETTGENAIFVAEKIRTNIRSMQPDDNVKERLSVTIGLAWTLERQSLQQDLLIEYADSALYKGKNSGKNQVVPIEVHSQNSLDAASEKLADVTA